MNRTRFTIGRGGFTLIEIMVASIGAAMILVAIYGVFYRAVKMRDTATEHTRESRMRARAVNIIRDDLRGALISGGTFATTLDGGNGNGPESSFPGYLKISTTTGKDTLDAMYGDVQQVEYYIDSDKTATGTVNAGALVRTVTRDLLATVQQNTPGQQVLSGVKSMEVAFYDGQNWKDSWQYSTTTTTLPQAVRVRIQQAVTKQGETAPPPVEILVPWATQPFVAVSTTSTTTQ
jgi:type II secretory pathway component PulJ